MSLSQEEINARDGSRSRKPAVCGNSEGSGERETAKAVIGGFDCI